MAKRRTAKKNGPPLWMDNARVRVSASGFGAFLKTIAAPAAAVPEMVALLDRPAPWESDRRRNDDPMAGCARE